MDGEESTKKLGNLFVSFELHSPSRNYIAVECAIGALGHGIRVHTYMWYAETAISSEDAIESLEQVVEERDSVLVPEAKDFRVAWSHISHDVAKALSRYRQVRSRQTVEKATQPRGEVTAQRDRGTVLRFGATRAFGGLKRGGSDGVRKLRSGSIEVGFVRDERSERGFCACGGNAAAE